MPEYSLGLRTLRKTPSDDLASDRTSNVISQKRFVHEALSAHNVYREKHNVPDLVEDEFLSYLAMDWAEKLAHMGHLEYKNFEFKGELVGENITRVNLGKAKYYNGYDVTDLWYNESELYDGRFAPNVGHFTQMVWRNTTKVGFGFAVTEDGQFYVVANYYPAGNVKNQFVSNVFMASSSSSSFWKTKNINVEASVDPRAELTFGAGVPNATISKLFDNSKLTREVRPENEDDSRQTNATIQFTRPDLKVSGGNISFHPPELSIGQDRSNIHGHQTLPEPTVDDRHLSYRAQYPTISMLFDRSTIFNELKSLDNATDAGKVQFIRADPSQDGANLQITANVPTFKMPTLRLGLRTDTDLGQDPMHSRFIKEALDKHNYYRQRHGVEPLRFNADLTKMAQEWSIHLAEINTLEHSENKFIGQKVGENVAYAFDSSLEYYSGEEATDEWYSEVSNHDFSQDYQDGSNHFTQVIWRNTRDVGFGISRSADGAFFVVANYFPAGNVIGQYIPNCPRERLV